MCVFLLPTSPDWLWRECGEGGGGRETAPPALCLTSAPVIWYTTDSPSEYERAVSRQTAVALSSPVCLFLRSSFLRLACPNLPAAQTAAQISDKVCAALQMYFPEYYKTSATSCFACTFHPCYLRGHLFRDNTSNSRLASNVIRLFNVWVCWCGEKVF